MAIYGFFPAKVTMEGGRIKGGDPITSSSRPGYGMKATGACRIIGYALENASRAGTIQVFAAQGETSAPSVRAVSAQLRQLKRENPALEARLTALEQTLQANAGSTTTTGGSRHQSPFPLRFVELSLR